ncbi:DUF3006 domain-containing protein [Deinococcus koreensis]|uniref:DUF3006 domain-containing protein n=1 Tax=Deinococcus koreensis TaxID=2054903 RepID=A0A2K3UY98_9DEIO|nr:DUF3006 domain-containing protein [Deinococcus koreensis]PNY81504.1 DUF3006 domain-containing protein [Deinococcus koreensis]
MNAGNAHPQGEPGAEEGRPETGRAGTGQSGTGQSEKGQETPPAERWIVDGLESTPRGQVARLERPDGTTGDLPLASLPGGVREGDVLAVQDGPDGVTLHLLPRESAALREAAQARLDALNGADPAEADEPAEIRL